MPTFLYRLCSVLVLCAVLCAILIHRFTDRPPEDQARERARIMLQRIAALQRAHRAEHGTYLPIDRENNARILQLDDAPGPFRYRVVVSSDGFTAYAEADADRYGTAEVWMLDAKSVEPVLKNGD